jgi:hypothetical protein
MELPPRSSGRRVANRHGRIARATHFPGTFLVIVCFRRLLPMKGFLPLQSGKGKKATNILFN